jgi:thiamine pyrophosphokinase
VRALVIANGDPPSASLLGELAAWADLVVAADGGADRALRLGVEPGFVIGDLDSLSKTARERLGPDRLVHDPDADRTDLQKAIEFALHRGATTIAIAGAGGARADHALANLSMLVLYRGRADIRLVDDLFTTTLVNGEATIDAEPGTVVSLIALPIAEGVTTNGLRWELTEHRLEFGTYGVHNEVATRPARVRVHAGTLLLFTGRFVERHG